MERGAEVWFSEAQPEPVLTDLPMTAESVLQETGILNIYLL